MNFSCVRSSIFSKGVIALDADDELIEGWFRGREECAQMLVGRYYPQMLNLLYRLTGARSQAEELTQDLFMRLTEQVAANRPIHHLSAWLYTAALNLWRDKARRQSIAHRVGMESDGSGKDPEETPTPTDGEAAIHAELDGEVARRAVLGLSPPYREVIVLFYYQERSYEKIASFLDIPVGTVRSRLHYAVEALRKRLKS